MTPTPTPQQIEELAHEAGIKFVPMTIDGTRYDYRNVSLNDNIGGDEAGCIERFATLVLERFGQAPSVQQEPVAWESTTPTFEKYITQSRYEKFKPGAQRWYKPYRCTACANPAPAEVRGPLTIDELAELMPDDHTPMSLGDAFVKFARLVEQAHGITGGKA